MYTIEEIELDKFLGMRLNNVTHFKMSVNSVYTLILGRNGCGKSRLMAMLNPLAPTKLDIGDGGRKRIVIQHNLVRYELISTNHKGTIKNTINNLTAGTTLIDNANNSVHNALVNELFHYDKDIHDILSGQLRLTSMRTPERRYWFSQLSESDLGYALKFYQRAKERRNMLSGALKDTREQIGEIQPRVLASEEERVALKERIDVLQHDIGILDKGLIRANPVPNLTMDSLDALDKRLDELNSTIQATPIHIPTIIAGIDYRALEHELITLDADYHHWLARVEDLVKRIERIGSAERVDLGKLYGQIEDLTLTIKTLTETPLEYNQLNGFGEHELRSALEQYREYAPTLIQTLTVLNSDYALDDLSGRYAAICTETGEQQQAINFKLNQIALREQRLADITHVHDVECDNCHHHFKPGVKVGEGERLQAQIAQWHTAVEKDQLALAANVELGKVYLGFVDAMRKVSDVERYFSNHPVSAVIFQALAECQAYLLQPRSHIVKVQRFGAELERQLEIAQLRTRQERLTNDAQIISATQTENVDELKALRVEADAKVHAIQLRQRELKQLLELHQATQARITRLGELGVELEQLVHSRTEMALSLIENVRVDVMREHRRELWDLLITSKQRYEVMEREHQNLETLEAHLVVLTARMSATSKVVKAMSPDAGILAKHLYQCITKVTDLMSAYINRIWGYEMKILPCDVSDGEMDYKFPFWANDPSIVVGDVSMGSKGQQEVIDFVFMLAVYRALKLDAYPLFLDELGSGFDETHRPSMINFIKSLIDRGQHSSVFMVSHDAASHYQLTHSNVVILDPNGVTLPPVYNQFVELH